MNYNLQYLLKCKQCGTELSHHSWVTDKDLISDGVFKSKASIITPLKTQFINHGATCSICIKQEKAYLLYGDRSQADCRFDISIPNELPYTKDIIDTVIGIKPPNVSVSGSRKNALIDVSVDTYKKKRVKVNSPLLISFFQSCDVVFFSVDHKPDKDFSDLISRDAELVKYYISSVINASNGSFIDKFYLMPDHYDREILPADNIVTGQQRISCSEIKEIDPFTFDGVIASELWKSRYHPLSSSSIKTYKECKELAMGFVNTLTNSFNDYFWTFQITTKFNTWFLRSVYHKTFVLFSKEKGTIFFLSIKQGEP